VVMPFAGDAAAARAAIDALRSLRIAPGDELILVDNAGTVAPCAGVTVIRSAGEHSPAHARNAGAAHAKGEWILFIDSDTRPNPRLLDAYFSQPPGDDAGALVGDVLPAPAADTVAARYGNARSFLGQRTHLQHPFMPRAAAANLMVRRAAFVEVGGFYEGLRSAEDTDFSWRLQRAGWRLEPRGEAWIEHRYRSSIAELRRQWRGYAAGRAWLARRYEGFVPQPAVLRALSRASAPVRRGRGSSAALAPPPPRGAPPVDAGRLERGRYLALDALLSVEELAGFALSNRPVRAPRGPAPVDVVLVADRFPALGDPLAELAGTLEHARVEAVARPEALDVQLAGRLQVDYLEDDGAAARIAAALLLLLRHPVRCALDLLNRGPGEPALRSLAPAVRRVERDRGARLQALGGPRSQATAERIATLARRAVDR
jgi:GT2 family glycosyltransferase